MDLERNFNDFYFHDIFWYQRSYNTFDMFIIFDVQSKNTIVKVIFSFFYIDSQIVFLVQLKIFI